MSNQKKLDQLDNQGFVHWTLKVPQDVQEAVYDEQDRRRKERTKRPSIEEVVINCIREQLLKQ